MAKTKPLTVYFLINKGVHLLDLAGPAQAFQEASALGAAIKIHYIGFQQQIESFQGLNLSQITLPPKQIEVQSVVIVVGSHYYEGIYSDVASQKSLQWLKQLDSRNILLVGICTGSFLLAKASLLDGKQCTTHHSVKNSLQKQFPKVNVVSDCIFVEDNQVITTAGVTAGLDVALEIIDRYFGQELAIKVARDLVIHRRRLANDPQISVHLHYRNHISPLVHEAQDYIEKNYLSVLSQNTIAEELQVSLRHLQRVFKQYTGVTMFEYGCILKVEHAGKLISNGYNLLYVSHASGFPNIHSLKKYLKKYGDNT